MTPYICPVCHREAVKVMHRTPCADCHRIAHRAVSIKHRAKKRAELPPPAPQGKGWDSSKSNALLRTKL
jgi:hypothetical protein